MWDKTYGGAGVDKLTSILVTPDGYVVGGSSASAGVGDKSQASKGGADYWLLKLDNQATRVGSAIATDNELHSDNFL